ncbi:TIGR01459 family HAD-type hydrolase [Ruixingdingia sedimenti]|uniref:TIGR01459 family HAD-type hydrolase n=1 Tax=Ruixingdingia sedimenti TaxID=3073604 RepID=A0ABU1F6T6_9RHOB|nr:TIGR01459 family HAD-type hydrolase [Xinfangfangia sp. LG-4]MDR5652318.1 TIGR01459 family HAD-type hydrolase [Xinfangfangia sp. LG-4]
MTRLITALAEISADYDALFCDLWGCLHNGREPFAPAVAALAAFRARGGAVVLLTNAPRPKPSVVRQLDTIGVPRDVYDEVVTSGDAAQAALVAGAVGRRVWHLGPPKDDTFFTEMADDLTGGETITRVPLAEAEGIVCTGLFNDMTETPEDYRGQLLLAKVNGLKMLCANPDIAVDYGDKRLYCAGSLAQLYTEMGGTALYFGKPHPPIYDLARRRLAAIRPDIAPDRILAVGDGIATDVAGAEGEGLDALFVTGGLAAAEFGADPAAPDAGRLQAWLDARQMAPRYAIGRLG